MYGFLWDDGGGDDDKLWCRAVVGSLSDNKAQVLFPDYGNGDLVDVHALRELPPPFYQLPFQVRVWRSKSSWEVDFTLFVVTMHVTLHCVYCTVHI